MKPVMRILAGVLGVGAIAMGLACIFGVADVWNFPEGIFGLGMGTMFLTYAVGGEEVLGKTAPNLVKKPGDRKQTGDKKKRIIHAVLVLVALVVLSIYRSDDQPKLRQATLDVDRAHYTGEVLNSKPHGSGTMIWPGGNKYVGEFRHGERHGQGRFSYSDGREYVGEFLAGKRHGRGILTEPDGGQYSGEYRMGKRHGRGTLSDADGYGYSGDFREDEIQGHGRMTWPDGREYNGQFLDGEPNGMGTMRYPDGKEKFATWRNGEFERWVVAQDTETRHDAELARSLASDGKLEEAIPYYRKAVKDNPEDHRLHQDFGALLLDLGRNGQAVDALRSALVLRVGCQRTRRLVKKGLSALLRDPKHETIERAVSTARSALEITGGEDTGFQDLAAVAEAEADIEEGRLAAALVLTRRCEPYPRGNHARRRDDRTRPPSSPT